MKVYVGVSGGVDSAVSAALLKEQGHDVTGVFIKIWQPEFIECTWREERLDAMRVCVSLGIPFREIDLSHEYKTAVIDAMIASYKKGETPNPDILCNTFIKFGVFLEWAKKEGADKIATGHYARVNEDRPGHYELLKGIDGAKDQSYFMHHIGQSALSRALFPVGDKYKTEIRSLARALSLPVAEKPDSQGLCFVGDVSMRDFLKRYVSVSNGDVRTTDGMIIGVHEGAVLYTVGERQGFRTTTPGPWYVTKIDVMQNTLTVARERGDAAQTHIAISKPHWIGGMPSLPLSCNAHVRYHGEIIECVVSEDQAQYAVTLAKPHVVATGQSIVFYNGDKCLGGAVIR